MILRVLKRPVKDAASLCVPQSKSRFPGAGILPRVGYTGMLRPKGVPFCTCLKVGKFSVLVCFTMLPEQPLRPKEIAAKSKY